MAVPTKRKQSKNSKEEGSLSTKELKQKIKELEKENQKLRDENTRLWLSLGHHDWLDTDDYECEF